MNRRVGMMLVTMTIVVMDGCVAPSTPSLEPSILFERAPLLMFSELAICDAPGEDGTWIEIYNPSDALIRCKGISIMADGQLIYSSREVELPGKGILLVRFASELPMARNGPASLWRQLMWAKAISTRGLGGEPQGSCALFNAALPDEAALCDFVAWGNARVESEPAAWADGEHIWQNGVTIPFTILEQALIAGGQEVVLSRRRFDQDDTGPQQWYFARESEATPGSGNRCPAPWFGGLSEDQDDDGITMSIHIGNLEWPSTIVGGNEEDMHPIYRVQIALDPHFQHVVYDAECDGLLLLTDETLGSGSYFMRVRDDTPGKWSNWSAEEYFNLGFELPPEPQ